MKKGIRIALALVLALAMVLGSVGVAAAKGNPHRSVTVTPFAVQDGGTYDLGFTLEWNALRIQRVVWGWWSYNGTDWVYSGLGGVEDFAKAARSGSLTYDYYLYSPQDVTHGENWTVSVAVLKPKGKQQFVYAWPIIDEELVWP